MALKNAMVLRVADFSEIVIRPGSESLWAPYADADRAVIHPNEQCAA